MAKLSEILKGTEYSQVWDILANRYEDAANYKEIYGMIFQSLKTAKHYEGHQNMLLAIKENDFDIWYDDDEPNLQAVGIIPGDADYYAIGVLDPDQLAAIEVDPETAAGYSPADIAAYCLVEIMYFASAADSAWGAKNDTAAKGLIAAQTCVESEVDSVSLGDYRREMGLSDDKPTSGTDRLFK